MKNKKGAEMTIGTIVVIILALLVLVAIIYGFTTGWGNLWSKISDFSGGKVNVQSVIQGCELACATESSYDYCNLERKVVFGDEEKDAQNKESGKKYTCVELEAENIGLVSCSNINCP